MNRLLCATVAALLWTGCETTSQVATTGGSPSGTSSTGRVSSSAGSSTTGGGSSTGSSSGGTTGGSTTGGPCDPLGDLVDNCAHDQYCEFTITACEAPGDALPSTGACVSDCSITGTCGGQCQGNDDCSQADECDHGTCQPVACIQSVPVCNDSGCQALYVPHGCTTCVCVECPNPDGGASDGGVDDGGVDDGGISDGGDGGSNDGGLSDGGSKDGGSDGGACAIPCFNVPCCDEGTLCCPSNLPNTFYCDTKGDAVCPKLP